MGLRRGLIDSNVLVAASTSGHQHHEGSSKLLLEGGKPGEYATAGHCLAEFYSTVTRPVGRGGSAMAPGRAYDALMAYRMNIEVLVLSLDEQLNAIRRFATRGGTGPLIYDLLIGEVATVFGISTIVTWNVRHFAPLFPALRVCTPADFDLET